MARWMELGLLLLLCGQPQAQQPFSSKISHTASICDASGSCTFTFDGVPANTAMLELETATEVQANVDGDEEESGKKIDEQQSFKLSCKCSQDYELFKHNLIPMDIPFGKCAATKMDVVVAEPGYEIKTREVQTETGATRTEEYRVWYGFSKENIKSAIGNPISQTWVKTPMQHVSDISGRTDAKIIGFPGGDIGVFAIALNRYQILTETPLENSDCVALLKGFMEDASKKSFYMPADEDSVASLLSDLELGADVTETPVEGKRGSLTGGLVDPVNQASIPLRLMLQRPHIFRMQEGKNTKIPECAVRAFFEILWDKDKSLHNKMRLVLMDEEPAERGIVRVYSPLPCEAQQILPLVAPMAEMMFDELGSYLASQNAKVNEKDFKAQLKSDAAHAVDVVVNALKKPESHIHLPIIDVHFH